MSVFETLNAVNVNGHTEKKNGLTYLSWAWAWGELLKRYPDSTYTVYENAQGWNYHTDGKTCWVKTGVTVEGKEYIEFLPVMDLKNRSIPAEAVTSFDVNKAIQRSLTKAVARHGLGLYIYAGEDLPEEESAKEEPKPAPPSNAKIAKGWCESMNISTEAFGNYLKAAVKAGAVPEKRLNDMTDDEFNNVLKWVAANAS
jgi:hypothetical protein